MKRSKATELSFLTSLLLPVSIATAECVSGDCQSGFGTSTYIDGGVYQGSFRDGFRNGQGTYIWVDKSRYVGNWKNGSQSGQGSSYSAEGDVLFSGTWSQGQEVGIAANRFARSQGMESTSPEEERAR